MPSEPVDVLAALPPLAPATDPPSVRAEDATYRANRAEATLERALEMLDEASRTIAALCEFPPQTADEAKATVRAELARLAAGEPSDA